MTQRQTGLPSLPSFTPMLKPAINNFRATDAWGPIGCLLSLAVPDYVRVATTNLPTYSYR